MKFSLDLSCPECYNANRTRETKRRLHKTFRKHPCSQKNAYVGGKVK